MKKLILLFLPLLSVLANAEELKFVTVLSSPVGTFNKLEAVDSATPAKSPTINFCTSIGTGGTVTLKGTSKPEMKTVNLSQNTTLGREDTGNYVLNQITMKSGGTLKGSRLLAGTVQVNQATAGKSDKLYTETLTVAGAKANDLYVGGNKAVIKLEDNRGVTDPGMMWSNEYKTDKACGEDCKNQYLLKEKGNSLPGIFPGGDWAEEESGTYIWKKTKQTGPSGNHACVDALCPMLNMSPENSQLSHVKETLPANYFTSPACDAGYINKRCAIQVLGPCTTGNCTYCVTYECTKQ